MYRKPAETPPAVVVPDEFVFEAGARAEAHKSGIAVMQVFALPLVVGVVLAMVATPTLALVGMVASAVGLVLWMKRSSKARIVLRVDQGRLRVWSKAGKVSEPVTLDDLLNVSVDTKSFTPVQDGASAIPAMRVIASTTGPEVDVARIVLIARDRPAVAVGDEDLSHMDAMEWLGKIRVFLRKHGWVPQDERGEARPSVRGDGPASEG